MTSGLLGTGFILDLASAGMAKPRDFRAIQVSMPVGCSRVLNPPPRRIKTRPVTIATPIVKRTPMKNQRTFHYTSERELQRQLHQPRRRGFHYLAKETAVEIPIDRRGAEKLRVIEAVKRLPAELQVLRLTQLE